MIELQPADWLLWRTTEHLFVYKRLLVECLVARDGDQCFYCRSSLKGVPLPHKTIDHIVPVSRGGRTNFGNLVLACKWCNQHKGNRSRHQFERSPELASRRHQVLQAKIDRWRRENHTNAA